LHNATADRQRENKQRYTVAQAVFFVADCMNLSSFTSTLQAPEKKLNIVRWWVTAVQGRSRSSKSVPIESPHAISY